MELDDLKAAWSADPKPTTTPDIMELIHQKSRGPIAALKTAYRRQLAFVTVVMAGFVATQARNVDTVAGQLLFLTYIGFCLALIASLAFSYRLVRRMESADKQVRENLEQHVALLERRQKGLHVGARVALLFFILLLEVIPHFQSLRMLSTWHALHPLIRFSAYAGFLVFQFFLSRAVSQRKFGRHLDHLRRLLEEVR